MKVTLNNKIKSQFLNTRSAVPLGLIINEMVTNAIKHGFCKPGEVRFSVDLQKSENSAEYILSISNKVKPFPDNIDIHNPESLGLQHIAALVRQLEGTIELQREPSTQFTIRFPCREIEN